MDIIPAILAKNTEELIELQKKIGAAASLIQVDVADGKFVPSVTVGLEEVQRILGSYQLQIHLMVQNPEDIISFWAAEANVESVIVHVEASENVERAIGLIKSAGKSVGVAINPGTDAARLDNLLGMADFVQFMTVEPGAYGSPFVASSIGRISAFHAAHPDLLIQADGAVSPENIAQLRAAGVRHFAVGSFLVTSKNVGKAIAELQAKL
ncbi:MAG TPA: ribulose-phosphate 3-epimerase [Candidatus Paceibacterota bacterium]|nr:ribulose-phosphate 3-epimerase [Candidatus Paceibacterota bacterium]